MQLENVFLVLFWVLISGPYSSHVVHVLAGNLDHFFTSFLLEGLLSSSTHDLFMNKFSPAPLEPDALTRQTSTGAAVLMPALRRRGRANHLSTTRSAACIPNTPVVVTFARFATDVSSTIAFWKDSLSSMLWHGQRRWCARCWQREEGELVQHQQSRCPWTSSLSCPSNSYIIRLDTCARHWHAQQWQVWNNT